MRPKQAAFVLKEFRVYCAYYKCDILFLINYWGDILIVIESKENSLFKETKKLKERKGRTKSSKFIIEGFRLVEEAFRASVEIDYLIVLEGNLDKANDYLKQYNYQNIKLYIMKKDLFKELCLTEQPQGIIAVIKIKQAELSNDGSFYLLCDKVQDPGNLGTIIRTAHAAGVDGIIITKGTVDLYNDKTLRATMGSVFHIPIIFDDEQNSIIKKFISNGFSLIATSLEGTNNFFDEDLSGKIIISVGNEGNGVSDEIYKLSNKKVKIPMPGGAESLNVAVAASIIIYEKVRQSSWNCK